MIYVSPDYSDPTFVNVGMNVENATALYDELYHMPLSQATPLLVELYYGLYEMLNWGSRSQWLRYREFVTNATCKTPTN